MTISYLFP